MTRSQVYRELPALAAMGYVRLGKPGARSSQPYAITPSGKRAFARWLAETPGTRLSAIRSRCVPRSARSRSRRRSAEVHEAVAYHTQALAEIRDTVKGMRADGEPFAAAAQEFAVGYHKAALAWLKSAPTE